MSNEVKEVNGNKDIMLLANNLQTFIIGAPHHIASLLLDAHLGHKKLNVCKAKCFHQNELWDIPLLNVVWKQREE